MKIAYLCPFKLAQSSGTPIRALNYMELVKDKIDYRVYSLDGYNNTIKVPKGFIPFNLSLFFKLRSYSPNVIHVLHTSSVLCVFLYRLINPKVKIIFDYQGVSKYEMEKYKIKKQIYNFLDWLNIKISDHIIAVSTSLKDYAVNHYGKEESAVTVMWGPVDFDIFKFYEPKKSKQFTVCYSGNDSFWQGIPVLLDAIKLLKGKGIKFILAGIDKEKYDYMKDYDVELSGKIKREDLAKKMFKCNAFISPRNNSMAAKYQYPHKLSAYLALGRAVIGTDIADQRIVIESAKCGFVAKPGDAKDLAEKILLLKGEDYITLGKNARKFAETNFSKEKNFDILRRIYNA